MQKLHFSIVINASRKKVWDTMLNDSTYLKWTSVFSSESHNGSHFVGNWEQDSKMQFLSSDEIGKLTGMVSTIAENRKYEFLSIKHLGIVEAGIEDTTSEAAKAWQGFENYTLTSHGDQTQLEVDMDINDEYKEYFQEAWPKALAKLKELAEE